MSAKTAGKFFVFEGIDGSGKSTQSNLLAKALRKQGCQVEKIDFPQYGQKSAGLVEEYLGGKYGTGEKVGPYRASIFYACDRYDLSFKIKKWLAEGKVVISDRYVVSSVGHQGGKIIHNVPDWDQYVDWLYDLEYRIFEIPRPDFTFLLKISPELSIAMSNKIEDGEKIKRRTAYLGDAKKQDIHEADTQHLANALSSYLAIAKKFPEEYRIIDCEENGTFLPVDLIHQKIVTYAKSLI